MAPDVILEVDHINPVKDGGETDILNLVTSCRDCNRGKGARKLSDNQQIKLQQEQLMELNEKRDQLQMLLEWREELKSLDEEKVDAVNKIIKTKTNRIFSEVGRERIKKLINEFGLNSVLDATEIALKQYYDGTDQTVSKAINMIGGICKNLKKSETDPLYSYKSHISSILKKGYDCYDSRRVWNMLNKLITSKEIGYDVIAIANESNYWDDFWNKIYYTYGVGF